MGSRGRLGRGRKGHDFNYNFQHTSPVLDFLTITRKSHFLWDFQCYSPGTVIWSFSLDKKQKE